ncbi:MAG: 4-(cytidine 5'-diphospho)-2-C-methyl-D-erythritol kinase [Leptolyngbyaceae bacterium]|nr:4-(cytidine 5'-diphospho)-2-C-methyl-D-erythritol kinase [Leptolyngbyaceae bacterium]
MRSYTLSASAKINLYLEIIGDRPDGYHELAMVMQSVGLADEVRVRSLNENHVAIICHHPDVPLGPENLACKAAELMRQTFPDAAKKYGGVEITLQKHIPIGAGLAGGSSNAAAVLVGLDLLWGLGLTQAELQTLGATLGSDIPFCVVGGTAIATGRGERIAPLPDLDATYVVLAKYGSMAVSTPWAYKSYRAQFSESYVSDQVSVGDRHRQLHSGPIVAAITHKDMTQVGALLHNDLEKVVLPEYPQVQALRAALLQHNPLGAMMSGSGPTVFALAETRDHAEAMKKALLSQFPDPDLGIWVTQMVPSGIQLITDA